MLVGGCTCQRVEVSERGVVDNEFSVNFNQFFHEVSIYQQTVWCIWTHALHITRAENTHTAGSTHARDTRDNKDWSRRWQVLLSVFKEYEGKYHRHPSGPN